MRSYFSFKTLKNDLSYMVDPLSIQILTPEKWEELELEFLNTDLGVEETKAGFA
jgi:hypothetical protein